MRKNLYALTLAAILAATGASAATLNFVTEANINGERGVLNNVPLTISGVGVSFDAGENGVAYFDSSSDEEVAVGGAGLGVCSTGLTETLQCVTPSDDNVTVSESLTLTFDRLYNLSGLKFNEEGHIAFAANSTKTLLFSINGAGPVSRTFASLMTDSWDGVKSVTFAYGGDDAEQFYISALTAVPLPAGGVLLLTALGGIAALRRRKAA